MTERVLPAIYINMVYTAGVITQKSLEYHLPDGEELSVLIEIV